MLHTHALLLSALSSQLLLTTERHLLLTTTLVKKGDPQKTFYVFVRSFDVVAG